MAFNIQYYEQFLLGNNSGKSRRYEIPATMALAEMRKGQIVF
jgi:hypothetical protein